MSSFPSILGLGQPQRLPGHFLTVLPAGCYLPLFILSHYFKTVSSFVYGPSMRSAKMHIKVLWSGVSDALHNSGEVTGKLFKQDSARTQLRDGRAVSETQRS